MSIKCSDQFLTIGIIEHSTYGFWKRIQQLDTSAKRGQLLYPTKSSQLASKRPSNKDFAGETRYPGQKVTLAKVLRISKIA